mgnify:CR=1 FL=1
MAFFVYFVERDATGLDIVIRKDWLKCCNKSLSETPLAPDESPDMHYEDDSPYPLDGEHTRDHAMHPVVHMFNLPQLFACMLRFCQVETLYMNQLHWFTWRRTGCTGITKLEAAERGSRRRATLAGVAPYNANGVLSQVLLPSASLSASCHACSDPTRY